MIEAPVRFTKRLAKELTAGLSQTDKMPCRSWSIPVFMCKRGAVLAKVKGSACEICYADKGLYAVFRENIEPAQVARLDALYSEPEWACAIAALIGADPEFRWFDAGDLQDLFMLEQIAEVCRLTPHTQHWLPTREYEIVAQYIAKHGALPPNLVIRLSAFMVDKPVKIPSVLRGVPGVVASEIHTAAPQPGSMACNAPQQGNKCADCRACWSRDVAVVSYHAH